ncbi:tautomerase family protein [Verminephrobacter eiseniae]|uniref:hypothetical protein n=1 Tax=Verminephrobacter eiseniae TaxID=364317 RepID=UPI0010DAA4DE|nr:hypothetical protein [Verminephrobacter eiseniae]KAB7627414.1 hypothetical protein ET532_004440 [Verminephrobacter sp. Larva24]MCW5230415.1 hypothetical protein [Verminephrobacter eiseniae]MCW5260380.1 hypothetical protein [Verminephrobacter eiseniae]MCW5292149.1 hypothetical protein [Verminephrobacter eiseniae]MCW8187228.1 hypothetical protein [Verminephrobacter eiseniae]
MPHVNSKHFPLPSSEPGKVTLTRTITDAVQQAFGCSEGSISIALEAVSPDVRDERVYRPEIDGRRQLRCEIPDDDTLNQQGRDHA